MGLWIIEKFGFFFVVQKFWNKIYTYKVCNTREEAEETLNFIENNYAEKVQLGRD